MKSVGRARWWLYSGVMAAGVGAALLAGAGVAAADSGDSDSGSRSSSSENSASGTSSSVSSSSESSLSKSSTTNSQARPKDSAEDTGRDHRVTLRAARSDAAPERTADSRSVRADADADADADAGQDSTETPPSAAVPGKVERRFGLVWERYAGKVVTLPVVDSPVPAPDVAAVPPAVEGRAVRIRHRERPAVVETRADEVEIRADEPAPAPAPTPEQVIIRFLREVGVWRNTAPEVDVIAEADPAELTAKGVVVGQDREGDPLAYTVVRPPNTGSVTIDAATGAFVYTPGSGGAPADSFGVAVADGLAGGTRVVVVSVNLAGVPVAKRVDVVVGHATLQIPRGDGSYDAPADWYFPTGDEPPTGIIWLQHGFLADRVFYSALATTLAEQTNSIVVAPSLTSNFLEPDGFWLNGRPMEQAVAGMFTGDRAQLNASAAAAGFDGALPEQFVLVGHSAGGGFAATVAGYTVDNGAVAHLAGVVLLDGVPLNEAMPDALAKLDALGDAAPPVYQIAAPPQPWNVFGRGTDALLAARPGQFNGVVLVGGSHVDAMLGSNPLIDISAQLVSGISPVGHTQAVGTVAVGWINDFYSDSTQYGVYGTPGEQLVVDQVNVSVLPASAAASAQVELLVNAVASAVMRLLFDGPGGQDPVGVTIGHSDLEPADGVIVDADWYFPDSGVEPTGVIYLQHGFFRSNTNVSALAVALARETNSIVVAPSLSSNFLGGDAYWINGEKTPLAVAGLFAGDRTALNASAAAAGYTGGALPAAFVLAGHSAGGNLVTAAGGYLATAGSPDLKGIVLLDAVDRDGAMRTGLIALAPTKVPVYQIAAEPCLCNAFGAGTEILEEQRPGQFVGVRLVGGSHVDPEGVSTDLLGSLACGFSAPANTTAVPTLAAGWIADMFSGGVDRGLYGGPGDRISVGGATAVVLV